MSSTPITGFEISDYRRCCFTCRYADIDWSSYTVVCSRSGKNRSASFLCSAYEADTNRLLRIDPNVVKARSYYMDYNLCYLWDYMDFDRKLEVLRNANINPCLEDMLTERAIGLEIIQSRIKSRGDMIDKPKISPSIMVRLISDWLRDAKLFDFAMIHNRDFVEYGIVDHRVWYGEDNLKSVIRIIIRNGFKNYTVQRLLNGVLEDIKGMCRPIPQSRLSPARYLNHENVVVDLVDFKPVNDADAVFTYELPEIDPKLFDRIKNGELTPEDFEDHDFYRILRPHYDDKEWGKLLDAIGATIAPYSLNLFTIIVGEKLTRKTFLYTMIKNALGRLAAVVDLSTLDDNRFALQNAIGSRLILSSESAQAIIRNIEIIKRITGGDPLQIDIKHKNPIVIEENIFKIMVFTNDLPVFRRYDEALIERIQIIRTMNPEEPTREERMLMRKLCGEKRSQAEFLEFIYACYYRLREKGFMIEGKGGEEVEKSVLEAQTNIYDFIRSMETNAWTYRVHYNRSYKVEGTKLYEAYLEWCRENGEEALGRNIFYDQIAVVLGEKGVVKTTISKIVYFKGMMIEGTNHKLI